MDIVPCFFPPPPLILHHYQVTISKRALLAHKEPVVMPCCFIKFSSICWICRASRNPIPSCFSSLNFFKSKLLSWSYLDTSHIFALACAFSFSWNDFPSILLFCTLRLRSSPTLHINPFMLASLSYLAFFSGKIRLLWGLN